jgi:hypothetical protein
MFTVSASSATAVNLLSPDPTKGGENVVNITNVPFSWSRVQNATSYRITISPNSDLSDALANAEVTGTAYTLTEMLSYDTTYYWQVLAMIDGVILSTSSIGTFTTVLEGEEPMPPVVVEETTPPDIVVEQPQITPTWIYAMIGIGAALVVVVIVLIVRTRRPS